jgi:hypothetical protein
MSPAFTLIHDGRSDATEARLRDGRASLAPEVVHQILGWQLEPEGLCQGDVCIPVRDRQRLLVGGAIDLAELARALGRPLVLDAEEGAAALGTAAADRAAQLAGREAPDFRLPDLDGRMHSLSDHRGRKVLLIAYASW